MDIENKFLKLGILLTKLQIKYSDNHTIIEAIEMLEEIKEMVLGPSK